MSENTLFYHEKFYSLPNEPFNYEGWPGSKFYRPVIGEILKAKNPIICLKVCTRAAEAKNFSVTVAAALSEAVSTGSMSGVEQYREFLAPSDEAWDELTARVIPTRSEKPKLTERFKNNKVDENGED